MKYVTPHLVVAKNVPFWGVYGIRTNVACCGISDCVIFNFIKIYKKVPYIGIWFKNRDVITKWVHFAAICKRFQPFGTFATERHSINQYVVQQVAKSLCKNILSITQP